MTQRMAVPRESYMTYNLEKLISDLEFENQQYVKLIESERHEISSLETQLEESALLKQHEEAITPQLDSTIKTYHRQYIHNKENIHSLKQTLGVVKDHEDALTKQVLLTRETNEAESKDHAQLLQHYQEKWEKYKTEYDAFPKAVEYNGMKQNEETLESEIAQLNETRMELGRKVDRLKRGSDIKPFLIELATLQGARNTADKRFGELKATFRNLCERLEKAQPECNKVKEGTERKSLPRESTTAFGAMSPNTSAKEVIAQTKTAHTRKDPNLQDQQIGFRINASMRHQVDEFETIARCQNGNQPHVRERVVVESVMPRSATTPSHQPAPEAMHVDNQQPTHTSQKKQGHHEQPISTHQQFVQRNQQSQYFQHQQHPQNSTFGFGHQQATVASEKYQQANRQVPDTQLEYTQKGVPQAHTPPRVHVMGNEGGSVFERNAPPAEIQRSHKGCITPQRSIPLLTIPQMRFSSPKIVKAPVENVAPGQCKYMPLLRQVQELCIQKRCNIPPTIVPPPQIPMSTSTKPSSMNLSAQSAFESNFVAHGEISKAAKHTESQSKPHKSVSPRLTGEPVQRDPVEHSLSAQTTTSVNAELSLDQSVNHKVCPETLVKMNEAAANDPQETDRLPEEMDTSIAQSPLEVECQSFKDTIQEPKTPKEPESPPQSKTPTGSKTPGLSCSPSSEAGSIDLDKAMDKMSKIRSKSPGMFDIYKPFFTHEDSINQDMMSEADTGRKSSGADVRDECREPPNADCEDKNKEPTNEDDFNFGCGGDVKSSGFGCMNLFGSPGQGHESNDTITFPSAFNFGGGDADSGHQSGGNIMSLFGDGGGDGCSQSDPSDFSFSFGGMATDSGAKPSSNVFSFF